MSPKAPSGLVFRGSRFCSSLLPFLGQMLRRMYTRRAIIKRTQAGGLPSNEQYDRFRHFEAYTRDKRPRLYSSNIEGEFMNRLRILLLAPDCNPEQVSIPYVTYSHAAALAQLHDVTLIVRSPSEEPVRRAKAPFRTIEVVRMPLLDRLYAWSLRRIFQ